MDATEPLRRAARCWPDREAVRAGGRTITFGDLERRVNGLARLLGHIGIDRGDRVATSLPDSLSHVVAELAVLRAGAAWVAINRRLARPEVDFMLEHSGARVLLTDAAGAAVTATTLEAVLDVSGDDREVERGIAAGHDIPPAITIGEDDVGRLRYTSGTTGRPKAAVLTHASALASLRSLLAELHELGPDDVVAHAAPLTHASQALLAPAIWRGARTVVCSGFDPAELRATIARERVTTIFLVPTMIAALLDEPGGAPDAFASLRTIVYGAAPISGELLARALDRFGPILLQVYGLSECPFPITTLRKADHLDLACRGTCGLPTAMSEVRVLAPDGTVLGPGEIGQIAVRGPQMMREYWRDPEATAVTLVDGWLHSGDLGVVDAAGFLTLVDRSDDVIITGGFNVYPREVELVLEAHPAVVEAGVAAVPHARWGQGVGAWVVRRPGMNVLENELVDFCRQRLAGYKKPVRVAFVDTLPRNSTGKVLRRALREQAGRG